MRLLCLNQFAPPDPAPTARLLGELGNELESLGWEVTCVAASTAYRRGKGSGWRRWLRELAAHARLLWRGFLAPRPDVILCLTDPPCLPVTAMILARLRGAGLAHWAMDVYPQTAVALREIREDSMLSRMLTQAMNLALGHCQLIACLDEDMMAAMGLKGDPRMMLSPPWPPKELTVPEEVPAASPDRVRWLYSGNLGRAHDYETLLQAQRLLEDSQAPFDLVFQGGGPAREAAQQRASELNLAHCQWLDYVPDDQVVQAMLEAHVLVASQKPETRGLLWPSKISLMQLLPRPIAWVGPLDGMIAHHLHEAGGRHGVFASGDAAGLASWLRAHAGCFLNAAATTTDGSSITARIRHLRHGAGAAWHARLSSLVTPGS